MAADPVETGTHTPKTLGELQSLGLPHLDWRDLMKAEGLNAEDESALSAHFAAFIPWQRDAEENPVCVSCGRRFYTDMLTSALLGGSEGTARLNWSLAHGEAHCSGCGYPARMIHYDVGPIKRLNLGLQYHPDVLKAEGPRRDR